MTTQLQNMKMIIPFLMTLILLCSCNEKSKPKKSGIFEVKKYKNGILDRVYEAYKMDGDTIINGDYREYYSNGQIRYVGKFIDGKQTGLWKFFHDNGVLKYSLEIINDNSKDGELIFYDRYGKLGEKLNLIGGKQEGERRLFFSNGMLSEVIFYKNDQLDHVVYCKDNLGNDLPLGTLKNGNGSRIIYHPNGMISEVLIYKYGNLEWCALNLDSNGNQRNGGNLINGKGIRIRYDEFGYADTIKSQ